MSYKPYYENGWKSGEAGGTPITPEALNHMEEGIEQAYEDLAAKSHGNHVPTTQSVNNATFLRNDNTWQKVTPANIGAAASSHGNHVPATQSANSATFLRNDNTWQKVTPANIGAAASSHGNHVPTTQTASSKVFLRNDNTWQTVTPANIGAVPTSRTVNGKALSANISLTAANVGAVSITQVWKNASPTAAFKGQSLSLTLSGYDAVLIQTRTHIESSFTYGETETSLICRVGGKGMIHDASESGAYLVTRAVTVATGKITFADAKYAATYANLSSMTVTNNSLIPTYIYGINW